jgi:hypothetical protein
MNRLIDTPAHLADEFKALRRESVLLKAMEGKSDEDIYQHVVGLAVEAARREGCDEADVEVIAAQARRDVADILAESLDIQEWKSILHKATTNG